MATGIMKLADIAAFKDATTGRLIKAVLNKPVIELRSAAMKFYDASWRLDEQTASGDVRGSQHALGISAEASTIGCMQGIEKQIIYGDSTVSGFNGLLKILKAAGRASNIGGTGSKLTSALLLDETAIGLLFGNDAQLFANNPILYGSISDADGNEYWGYKQPRSGYCGVDALDYKGGYCLHGIDTTDGATEKILTDDVIFNALSNFDSGRSPTVIAMSRLAQEQLRASRTATNATGAPAPTPTEVGGIPIIVCDSILNTETAA